jgi:phage gp46-like protein
MSVWAYSGTSGEAADGGDYIVSGRALLRDDGLASTCALLLAMERGSSSVAPEQGNRAISGGLVTASGARDAEAAAREALAPVIATGRLTNLRVRATLSAGRIDYEVSFGDAGDPAVLELSIPRGA